MGYYQGDFGKMHLRRFGLQAPMRQISAFRARGVRGDPGFFSFLGGVAKAAAGFIPGVGPIVSHALEAIPSPAKQAMVKAGGAIIKHPVLSAAGAAGAVGAGAAVEHIVKGHKMHVTPDGVLVHHKRRHMNVCNPRALRRAVRRAHGFAKLAMRTIHLVHPKKKVRFGGFRKRRAKR